MKKCLSSIILILSFLGAMAQNLSYEDFKKLIPLLEKEDWKNAYNQSEKLLASSKKDTSNFRAIILYANILSAAGMVTENSMSYKEIEKNLIKYKGQKIIFSSHPITEKEGSLNCVQFSGPKLATSAFITATNKRGINILCFEKIVFKHPVSPTEFAGSFVRCGGILDKIEFNPNKSLIWIIRLTVKEGFANAVN
ncbi:hypothetical protein [Pedobacter sp. KACC 23697]|uniref:Uncharacterized protein n=1 Tax=Pedobacter sp. KACC 23697 TaxID=3149230 RepID=A0AAU7K640_9SPHI